MHRFLKIRYLDNDTIVSLLIVGLVLFDAVNIFSISILGFFSNMSRQGQVQTAQSVVLLELLSILQQTQGCNRW